MTGLIWTRERIKSKTGILSIMIGRPRKAGKRKPSGRLAQVYVNPKAQVARQPHRLEVPARFRDWPEAGTGFGRMMILSHITPAQFEAGQRYAELYRSYQRSVLAPGHDPRAMDYEPKVAGKSDGMPDRTAARIGRVYIDAFNAMENLGWQMAVMHHAVHDRAVSTRREQIFLVCGLNALVKHFGIDERLQITSRAKCMVQ